MVLAAKIALTSIKTEPARKGAAANFTLASGLVNQAKRLVIKRGPMIEVTLITLVRAPCNSPCSFLGTLPEIIDCKAGPAMPPRHYGTRKTNIIQPSVAKENNNSPKAYKPRPI